MGAGRVRMPFRVRSAEWKKDGKPELTIRWRDLDGTQKHLKVVVDVRVEGDVPSEAEREAVRRQFLELADEWLAELGMALARMFRGVTED